jgi:hypothetical protein
MRRHDFSFESARLNFETALKEHEFGCKSARFPRCKRTTSALKGHGFSRAFQPRRELRL